MYGTYALVRPDGGEGGEPKNPIEVRCPRVDSTAGI